MNAGAVSARTTRSSASGQSRRGTTGDPWVRSRSRWHHSRGASSRYPYPTTTRSPGILHPEHWGRGYAIEASAAVLRRAFAAGVPEVIAIIRETKRALQGRRSPYGHGIRRRDRPLLLDDGRAVARHRETLNSSRATITAVPPPRLVRRARPCPCTRAWSFDGRPTSIHAPRAANGQQTLEIGFAQPSRIRSREAQKPA